MTNLVGVARYLASHRDGWSGTIVFIGQPAEELGKGAKAMLDDGLLARFPRPDFAIALHEEEIRCLPSDVRSTGICLNRAQNVDTAPGPVVEPGRRGHILQPDARSAGNRAEQLPRAGVPVFRCLAGQDFPNHGSIEH